MEPSAARPRKIVSGGQTGADRAALDFATANNIFHGGWCPKGRLSEDGVIAACYALRETTTQAYPQRTEWNVRDSDGTVIITINPELTGGSKKTASVAAKLGKPCLHLHAGMSLAACASQLVAFVAKHDVKTLNVAGPRGSKEPTVGEFVKQVLTEAF